MQTIAICSTKGGTGKSTLATALAVHASAGSKVALIDLDGGQGSTAAWADIRAKNKLNGPVFVDAKTSVRVELRKLARQGFDYVILDTPPTLDDSGILENAVDMADVILSPCRPSMFDLGASQVIAELAGDKPIGFVLTDATEEWPKINRSAAKELANVGHVFRYRLTHRPSYVTAIPSGRTGPDIDDVAAGEVEDLWGEVSKWMKR